MPVPMMVHCGPLSQVANPCRASDLARALATRGSGLVGFGSGGAGGSTYCAAVARLGLRSWPDRVQTTWEAVHSPLRQPAAISGNGASRVAVTTFPVSPV